MELPQAQGYVAQAYLPSDEEGDHTLESGLIDGNNSYVGVASRLGFRRQLAFAIATASAGLVAVGMCAVAGRSVRSEQQLPSKGSFVSLSEHHHDDEPDSQDDDDDVAAHGHSHGHDDKAHGHDDDQDSDAPAAADSQCSAKGENCWTTRCCANPKHTCYMKNPAWAGCLEECTPGKHDSDPKEVRTAWNCYLVQKEGPAIPPAVADMQKEQQKQQPEVAVQAAAARAAPKAPVGDGSYPSLFCFEIIRTGSYELNLVKEQYSLRASIFGCEEWAVLSDKVADLAPGVQTMPLGDLSTGHGVRTHFANTDIFSRAFDLLENKGKMMSHDFIVKVDPDAVFLPIRLKAEVLKYAPKESDGQPPNLYFQNCKFQDRLWMFGAVEVLSKTSLTAYFKGRDSICRNKLDYDNMGEDTFLSRCLDTLGVKAAQDFDLLADGYCSEAPGACNSNQVTYHPFKDANSWAACFHAAVR